MQEIQEYMDAERPNTLDQDYILQYENNYLKKIKIQKTRIDKIKAYSLYIINNELCHIKVNSIFLENNILPKEKLLYLIKKTQFYNEKKYKLVSLLKFDLNINIEELIEQKNVNTASDYLDSLKILETIKFNNNIDLITDINSIFLIFNKNKNDHNTSSNNTTKRIYIQSLKKTKRKTT